jgi:Flp pilus assembly protein TadD
MKNFPGKTTRMLATFPLPAWLSLLLLLAIFLLFSPAVNFEFLNFDDPLHVSKNKLITHFSFAKLVQIWSDSYKGLYIPLTYTFWGVLGRLSAWLHPANNPTILDPAVFHAANIILHAGSVLVAFAILRLLLQRDWPAAFGALLFGLHPVQVAPVAWISEMKGLLAGLLGLLAIWQYLRSLLTDQKATFQRHLRYVVASCFFTAALLAKPSVASVPLMAAILAVITLKRDWRRVALELSPWLLLSILLALITKGEQSSELLNFLPNFWQRILVAGDAITFYHTKLIWPFGLAPDYGRDPQEVLASGWIYITGLLPYAVVAILLLRVHRTWLLTPLLLFIAALLPVLGFIPFAFQGISTVANRYLYLAMLGPALVFAHLLTLYPGRRTGAAASILLLLLALRSSDRLHYWHDSLTFNLRAVEINPESALALNNLGVTYGEMGQLEEAAKAFKQAIAYAPDQPAAYANLGLYYAKIGCPTEAKAYYLKALEHKPLAPAKVYLMLGALAAGSGKPGGAAVYYRKALEIDPKYTQVYVNLGKLHSELEQFDEAIDNYQKAIKLDPYRADVYGDLGLLLELRNRREEAKAAYRQAIWLETENPDVFNNLGRLLLDENRSEEAVPLLRHAEALAPDQPNFTNSLGLAYLKLGQAHAAAECFRRALNINSGFAPALENLARAEALEKTTPATAGDF